MIRHIMLLNIFCFTLVYGADEVPTRTMDLEQAIQLSAATAPVDMARLDAAIARAQLSVNNAALGPQVDAVGTWLRQRMYQQIDNMPVALTPDNTVDARIRIGQSLIDLERWHRRSAAARQLDAAEAGTTLAMEESAYGAALAYADLVIADATLQVRERDLKLADELLTLAKAQVDNGASESIAATRAATRLASAQSALTAAKGFRHTASITLSRSLRLDSGLMLAPSKSLHDFIVHNEPTDLATALEFAMRQRAELQVSAATLAALRAETRADRGARLPTLGAFADAGRTGSEFDNMETVWRAGVELRIPLLNGQKYREDASRLRYQRQIIAQDDLQQRIAAEVRTAFVALENGRAGLTSANDEQRLAEQEVNEARRRFEAGVAGNLEVIDAQRNLALANERLVTAQGIVVRAKFALARALGQATGIR